MAIQMSNAEFRFMINNEGGENIAFSHEHPVPAFLCQPEKSQQGNIQFFMAYVNVVSLVNGLHHDECLAKITSPCSGCGGPAKDVLKSPVSYLHLAHPLVLIQIVPVCGTLACASKVRVVTIKKQNETVVAVKEIEKRIFLKLPCNVCEALEAKRCSGCGKVAYCGVECQKKDWKAHKPNCYRKNLNKSVPDLNAPYETI